MSDSLATLREYIRLARFAPQENVRRANVDRVLNEVEPLLAVAAALEAGLREQIALAERFAEQGRDLLTLLAQIITASGGSVRIPKDAVLTFDPRLEIAVDANGDDLVVSLRIAEAEVPIEFETDPDSGEVTAFNDELRVMATATTRDEAAVRFREALAAKLRDPR